MRRSLDAVNRRVRRGRTPLSPTVTSVALPHRIQAELLATGSLPDLKCLTRKRKAFHLTNVVLQPSIHPTMSAIRAGCTSP
jgi:hypothetical protein